MPPKWYKKIYKNTPRLKKPKKGFLNYFFWCVCILNSVLFNSLYSIEKKNKSIPFSRKRKVKISGQIAIVNYKFLNHSCLNLNLFFLNDKKNRNWYITNQYYCSFFYNPSLFQL
jgi:hypothetical protein